MTIMHGYMEVEVTLKQIDYLENTQKEYPKVVGYLLEDSLEYIEKETGNKHIITFSSDLIRFLNEGEYSSDTKLMDEPGETIVYSPYGNMKFISKLIESDKNDEFWSVEYQLFEGDKIITHQKMIWEFKKVHQSS